MNRFFLASIFLVLILSACTKYEGKATVHRNCTGTYLQVDGKEFEVCNYEMLEGYDIDAQIDVVYERINDCTYPSDLIVCEMYYEDDGFVKVLEIE